MSKNGFVEPLPAQPSLEMQQKRAKELLRAGWASDAAALERLRALHPNPPAPDALKLADAQLVIARGYGFSSWAALKQKIESLTLPPLERLVRAVKAGDVEAARALFAAHPELENDVNGPLGDFKQPLVHYARTNLALLDLLIEHGADLNARSTWWAGGFGILEHGLTPEQAAPLIERGATVTVWAASALGLIDRLRELLDAEPSLVNAPGGDGQRPLHCAATPEIADLLVDRGAELEARDVDHESTPLQWALDKPDVARRLLERGAEPDLFAAAGLGDARLCELCLERDPGAICHRLGKPPWVTSEQAGGKIYNWTLGHDLTPLAVARRRGHVEVVELLLLRAPPKVRFLDAIWNEDAEAARREWEQVPRLAESFDEDERQTLVRAAWWYKPRAVELCLDFGFDPHLPGIWNSTPLDRASFHGYAEIVATLLARDPNPPLAYRNLFGGTPLQACIHGFFHGWKSGHPQDHARTLELLLDAGATYELSALPTGDDALDAVLRGRSDLAV